MSPHVDKEGAIFWSFVKTIGGKERPCSTSICPAQALPDDAPQEVKDLAAQHWTPEVIAAAKEKYGIK